MSTDRRTRAWIEVQAGAVRRNLRRIREAVGEDVALIPMVKADAYGLGMSRAVAALAPLDPWGMGVATVTEGVTLRTGGYVGPVLVFSPIPPGTYERALEHGLTPCLSDLSALGLLVQAAARAGASAAPYHVEVDTGMGRAGFDWREAGTWGRELAEAGSGVTLTGCFTHFHSADVDAEATRVQWKRFEGALDALPFDRRTLMIHACNSAAALRLPELGADGVRPGIYLYGGAAGRDLPPPEPVVTLRARIVLIKEVPPGSTLGYGATHVARGWRRWATLGIGYGDGLPRSLGNRGSAVIRRRRVPIIGRISMDLTVVDITDLEEVEVGDVATLVGGDGVQGVTLEEVAELAGTINYEILTGLSPRLPRVWMDDGRD